MNTLKSKTYLILGIGTDVGKTFLVENLCKILLDQKLSASAIKPIISGFEADDLNSDSAKILISLKEEITQSNIGLISPWQFMEAVSPHIAAENIGKEIDFLEVVNFCQKKITEANNKNSFLFIEAAGGVMTPISHNKTFLDLAFELKIPTLLVSKNYLGSISHTLCAVEALINKKIIVEKIIINENALPQEKSSGIAISQMIKTVENLSKIPTLSLKNFLKK